MRRRFSGSRIAHALTRRHASLRRACAQTNYNGRDLPDAAKWRALTRVRTGETKTAGVVDVFYVSSDEPPKCVRCATAERAAAALQSCRKP